MRACVNCACVLVLATLVRIPAALAAKSAAGGQVVDSGSFGVFVAGKRVATENFHIEQGASVSVAKAELRADDGSKVNQRAELQISASGKLVHYEWTDLTSKSRATVDPMDEFVVERSVNGETQKKSEQPFMMPLTTMILDDYFFSHREILLWRYLASQCGANIPAKGCQAARLQYGVIVPHQQASAMVSLEFQNLDNASAQGSARPLYRFRLDHEGVEWLLWMDAQYKLQRISIPSLNTEVVRD